MNTPAPSTIRWFPRLRAGLDAPAAAHVEQLVSIAWLLMTEMYAYLEDVSGTSDDNDVQQALALRLAELATVVDLRLRGQNEVGATHLLPLLLEYGLTDLAHLSGEAAAETLALLASEPEDRCTQLTATYESMLAQFPGQLFNSLLPQSQGPVLRVLRTWNKLCTAAGTDPAFLVPLMRAL